MKKFLVIFVCYFTQFNGQSDTVYLKPGDKAPSFVLSAYGNSIQSFLMPYMKSITLLHFWSTDVITSRNANRNLKRLSQRYRNSFYKNAEGFEIIAIAVQSDKESWQSAISEDSLSAFTHGIAIRGLADQACKKYGVLALPTDILIDASGNILAVDPRITDIENLLDEQKNNQPLRKDITGILAQSSDMKEVLKYGGLYLFNYYGDTLAKTITNKEGVFRISQIKLNQDLQIKVDNKIDINTTDPMALYTINGAFITDGRTKEEGFVFTMPARLSNKLIARDTAVLSNSSPGEIDVIKNLTFNEHGTTLLEKDIEELSSILLLLQKNSLLQLELIAHTDTRLDKDTAMKITTSQVIAIKSYLEQKGISPSRIQAIAKGNTEPRKLCDPGIECREEDYKLNRRVEFLVYKN